MFDGDEEQEYAGQDHAGREHLEHVLEQHVAGTEEIQDDSVFIG